MDISAIGAGLSIRRPTIEAYINALEALYIVERVYPWTHTDYERVGKQSKIYTGCHGKTIVCSACKCTLAVKPNTRLFL